MTYLTSKVTQKAKQDFVILYISDIEAFRILLKYFLFLSIEVMTDIGDNMLA